MKLVDFAKEILAAACGTLELSEQRKFDLLTARRLRSAALLLERGGYSADPGYSMFDAQDKEAKHVYIAADMLLMDSSKKLPAA